MNNSKVIFGLLALILLLSLNCCSEPQDSITTPPPAFGDQIVPGEDWDPTKNYLLAQFNSMISIDSAKAVINQINGTSVKQIFVPNRWAYLKVEIGKKSFCYDILMTYPFVRYAEPNAIGIRGSNKV
ncbi:MAG: hypothetical protein KGZ85_09215 [Ignavibacterium sp.]|nr:hypothetical protein [Ignavibacterium sp.]